MTTFDEREKAFEAKLVHDEDLKFRAAVRANKWLGLWAAQKLGRTGDAADDYAAALIALELGENRGDAIFDKVRTDFDSARIEISDHQIRRERDEFLAMATKEITAVAKA